MLRAVSLRVARSFRWRVGASTVRGLSSGKYAPLDTFERRHNGPDSKDEAAMLAAVGVKSISELLEQTIPETIRKFDLLDDKMLTTGLTETQLLKRIRAIADKNQVFRSYIGTGYCNVKVPGVIQRNILESPGWYTQYTPYQPEISQGRLESLLNFQTMVVDLTGLPIADASLLDEGTAAAEAMALCHVHSKSKRKNFVVDKHCHPQTIACVKTRAEGFGIQVQVIDVHGEEYNYSEASGVLIQYPNTRGDVLDFKSIVDSAHAAGAQVACATDLLALTLLTPPGELGADIALGSAQRLGVPMGYGGPHAAFFACTEPHKRRIPGRIVGVSKDMHGNVAYRLALQTREQHIRREKATSNICTAQALLANMAAMYAVYHGPEGLRDIAQRIFNLTGLLRHQLQLSKMKVLNDSFFDTLTVQCSADEVLARGLSRKINLRRIDDTTIGVTLDETVDLGDIKDLVYCFTENEKIIEGPETSVPMMRTSKYLQHPVFNSYHSETQLLRYIYHLQGKDLSLAHAMIPLGSCTMKLNATTEMVPITWPEFANIHPFAPSDQTQGYSELAKELESDLAAITGFDAVSLQPNSGAQGEYTGLRVIRKYHASRGQPDRNVCLIPVSAHGTNPASAALAGMQIVVVKCLENGNLDMEDLKQLAEKYSSRLGAIMITYPSTYGVFEDGVTEACQVVHSHGGQVYMDGANMNAQVGLTSPGSIGADVCHLNLHKTFCIPHGGGGPGVGPIGVKAHLAPFLPSHPFLDASAQALGPVSAAPLGSASLMPIPWAYIRMMGASGLRRATQLALLSANYMATRLAPHYSILFTNRNQKCAHEFILDLRPFDSLGIEAIDVAKRLQDFSFHPPTMSWPVINTLMVEPTESESKEELDRFCDALICIRQEISAIESGLYSKTDNPLKNAPHTLSHLLQDKWPHPYSRQVAAFPVPIPRKFWPTTSRLDDSLGDRQLICSCPPISDYQ
ncbi:glycine decarboxylase subunit P [Entomophthora muscae]|uniref:Glycine decarboxylase subunit P n=1 Tax=Entomophthora muscae TaxID=34485 RepID=A0ACC2UCV4_9FUNG|nr:glycine decarboxylase subunit P [Entomophthora muscae]